MAASNLLALIDDIASTLDDVALLSKVAAKKTGGVIGDDLALNAQQVVGLHAHREIPVVLAVAKGSLLNKLILVPSALIISAFVPVWVSLFLVLGGLYLCFEGVEKVFEKIFHPKAHAENAPESSLSAEGLEKARIRGAIRTDFILSAEIIVITLGTVKDATLFKQASVLGLISLGMTVGVYGLVAMIVKLDDLGFFLSREGQAAWKRALGASLLAFAPYLMKFLGIAGTLAMFLVGGGILAHSLSWIHSVQTQTSPPLALGIDFLTGILAGILTLLFVKGAQSVTSRFRG